MNSQHSFWTGNNQRFLRLLAGKEPLALPAPNRVPVVVEVGFNGHVGRTVWTFHYNDSTTLEILDAVLAEQLAREMWK